MTRKPFSLLKLPNNEDPILHRLDTLKRYLLEDDTGEYIDELLVTVEEWCREYAPGQFTEIDRMETKIGEARFWLNEFFGESS